MLSQILLPDGGFFSPNFWWEKVPRKIHQENSRQEGPGHLFLGKINQRRVVSKGPQRIVGRGEKAPIPTLSVLLKKRPVLLGADFVLTKDRKWPYYGHFCTRGV